MDSSKETFICFLDPDLKTRLKIKAAKTKQTMTAYVISLLEANLKEK